MTMNKALENLAFATTTGGSAAAAQPAKVSSLKKPSRSRKATPNAEAPASKTVAVSPDVQLESTPRTAKPKAPPAKSTAVTHRHKKLEIASVVELEPIAVFSTPMEPSNEEIAKLAYSYYVARGYQPGNPAEDWFRAVIELRAKLSA